MAKISAPATREIIDDFAKEICQRLTKSPRPSKYIINFRNEYSDRRERDIVKVPIDLLRYRKDNGRIASDVLDYEYRFFPLDERDEDAQEQLRTFLEKKDPEKTDVLFKNILHSGQREPAIITCDGFLINGNRRKVVFEKLRSEYPEKQDFDYMNVVILPGKGDEGGPPTLLEIEKLENRYQLQREGRSEYYGFDRALSIRRKVSRGFTLEDQVRDDPQYAGATAAEINRAIKSLKKQYLDPLECVDRYLSQFRRDNQYRTVSTGIRDPQGRWEAFKDYSNIYNTKFKNDRYLMQSAVSEEDVGEIEEAAFDIIRLRDVPTMPKVHTIMRNFHNYCKTAEGKKHILEIARVVEPLLPPEEQYEDPEQKVILSRKELDEKWKAKYKEPITRELKAAAKVFEHQKERETPISLLEAALKKLVHKDMDPTSISLNDYRKARKLVVDIQDKAKAIEHALFDQQKKLRKLVSRK